MDTSRFDRIARSLGTLGSRRGVLSLLGALPLVGALASLPGADEAAAGKGHKKKKGHKHGKGKKPCVAEAKATTCAGKCATVTNNCGTPVDCGACTCTPACAACQICQGPTTPGTCVPDPDQVGDGCGAPGQVCQSDGACACDVCRSGCPFGSVQEAIDALPAGSTIHLCAGANIGGVTIAKNLTLIGVGDGDNPASNSLIDAHQTGRALFIDSGVTVALEKMRITGGLTGDDNGGGVRTAANASLTMTNCTVSGNEAPGNSGGGVFNDSGTLTMTNCLISGNTASSGGVGGGIANIGTLTMTTCTVANNRADTGAGIFTSGGAVTLNNCDIGRGNVARVQGGGILVFAGTEVTLDATRVTGNSAGPDGGGGINNLGGTVTLQNGSTVSGNTPDNCFGTISGGSCG